ncbi:MAG: hypothetical protein ACHQNE_01620 [Candidatus Kapaibacterium sp.]
MSIPSVEYQAMDQLRYPIELRRPYYPASEELRKLQSVEKNARAQWNEAAVPNASILESSDQLPLIRAEVVASIFEEYDFIGPARPLPPNPDEWE